VIEFTHMVMGPTCGMVLADLGAEVIKVEPVGHGHQGDSTRLIYVSHKGFLPGPYEHRTALDKVVQMMGAMAALPDGRETKTVLLPITLNGVRPGVRLNPPRLGEHSREILAALGYSAIEIEAICAS
jgi:crotonobetainyl-CoA:carnitine CoA-transferase CaiB-like acyl-CoA transferase